MTDSLIDGPTTISSTTTTYPAITATNNATGGSPEFLVSSYLFYVKIDNTEVGVFTDCSGIGATRATQDKVREGGVNITHIFPGPIEYSNITLKRGVTNAKV